MRRKESLKETRADRAKADLRLRLLRILTLGLCRNWLGRVDAC